MGEGVKGYEGFAGRRKPDVYEALLDTLESLDVKSNAMILLLPRHERFALAQEIKHSMNQIRRYAVSSWVLFNKLTALRNLDLEKEVLRSWASKCLILKYITPGQSAEWDDLINLFGRQIGGWIRHEREEREKKTK